MNALDPNSILSSDYRNAPEFTDARSRLAEAFQAALQDAFKGGSATTGSQSVSTAVDAAQDAITQFADYAATTENTEDDALAEELQGKLDELVGLLEGEGGADPAELSVLLQDLLRLLGLDGSEGAPPGGGKGAGGKGGGGKGGAKGAGEGGGTSDGSSEGGPAEKPGKAEGESSGEAEGGSDDPIQALTDAVQKLQDFVDGGGDLNSAEGQELLSDVLSKLGEAIAALNK
jgi:hypothetical protein